MNKTNFSWKNRNVFVTGGNGFLGSWITKYLLEKGANLTVLIYEENPKSNFYKWELDKKVIKIRGNIEDYQTLKNIINKYEIETVFHLAAEPLVTVAYREPLSTFETNIRGTYNLLEACRQSQYIKEIVIASSDKAYGENKIQPYTEEHPLQGTHPYDVSKSCTDLLAQTYAKTYNLPIVITRSGNFYGGGDLYFDRIIPHTIKQYLENKAPMLRSDGTHKRDYVYIKDVVSAYITLAENIQEKKLFGHAFNFGLGKGISVIEVVETIRKILNSEIRPTILNTAKSEIPEQYLNTDKISSMINWKPKYSLEQGLIETIEWYKKFLKIDSEKKKILITGANGFIGKHIVNKLSTENILVCDIKGNGKENEIIADLTDKESTINKIKEQDIEYVIHCAATLKRLESEREEIFKINLEGTKNLLEALKNKPIKLFVFMSTAEVCAGNQSPLNENTPYMPLSPYSESKVEVEKLIKESRIPYVILRPFIAYGPGQKGRMFLPQLIEAITEKKPFSMTKGEQIKDFIYVEDIADLCARLLEIPERVSGETFFVPGESRFSISEIADMVNDILDNQTEIIKGAIPYRENEIKLYSTNSDKLLKATGWKASTPLYEGLKKTLSSVSGNEVNFLKTQ